MMGFRSSATMLSLLLVSCGGGGGAGGSTSVGSSGTAPPVIVTPTAASPIEVNLGTTLQRPVFQCGSTVESLTADDAPGSVTVFESGPVRPLALSADGQRL